MRALVGEQDPALRETICTALIRAGIKGIVDCAALADIRDYLDGGRFDLLVVNNEIDGQDTTCLIRDVRSGRLHQDPFLVALLLVSISDERHVRLAMNSGADDVLLVPFPPEQLTQRVNNVLERRKPFIVTHDYIGPDRRRAIRPGEPSATGFPVPNPLLARATKIPADRYAEQLKAATATLTQARIVSLAKAVEWELRSLRKAAAEGGLPDDAVPRLRQVERIGGELIERLGGRVKTELIEFIRQQCQEVCDAPGTVTADRVIDIHDASMTMLSNWHLCQDLVASGAAFPAKEPEDGAAAPDQEPPTEADVPETEGGRPARDVTYAVPPELAHLLKRIEYRNGDLPPPQASFATFEQLCEAAVARRIDRVVTFFHRVNDEVVRPLPPIFLLSPLFAEKFRQAVATLILPDISNSRQLRMMASSLDLKSVDTDSFWDAVPPLLKASILDTWAACWDNLKLVDTKKEDNTRVLQVKDNTKRLREILAPSKPDDYDLPRIANREIAIFNSLLDPAIDWRDRLTQLWQACQDLYEQEMDPRVYQQTAREGALRDRLLAAFERFPDQWGDFVILVCHRVFPRIDTQFLERFSTNFGRTEDERETRMPFLIRYLRQAHERPEIRRRERDAEAQWQAQQQQLRMFLERSPG